MLHISKYLFCCHYNIALLNLLFIFNKEIVLLYVYRSDIFLIKYGMLSYIYPENVALIII